MTDRAGGLEFRPVGRRKPVDIETGRAGPDRRENAPAARDDARAAHDRIAHQHRARGRARNCVDLGGGRRPRSRALGEAVLAEHGRRQLDHDIDAGADVETFVIFGEAVKLFVIEPENGDRLGMMNEPHAGDAAFEVDPDEENQRPVGEPFRLRNVPGREEVTRLARPPLYTGAEGGTPPTSPTLSAPGKTISSIAGVRYWVTVSPPVAGSSPIARA